MGVGALLYQTYMKWVPIPLPPPGTFEGQIAVVTGGTSGLGLATAIHFINLGAEEVIITSRDSSRSQSALKTIELETNGRSKDRVRVADLDMNRYASVVAFTEEIKKVRQNRGGVDYVVLNAGLIGVDFKLSEEGWEQNIQVNTLSTVLIALLLLPWLKAEHANRSTPAHLAVVGSSRHLEPNIQEWEKWIATESGGVLGHYSKPENWPDPNTMYGATKLMAQYAVNELVKMALGPDGRPQVIINTMCPGIVATDLSKGYASKGIGFVVLIKLFTGLFGKSPLNGARTFIAACMTKESEHGKYIRFYGTEADYKRQAEVVITGEAGRKMQAQIWSEMKADFVAKVPETREILEA
ncbi:hypothetical protein M426DRAFT_10644 [Hypoxylon sp. CI-4A]|nr:hypothetical protein M426DRAFT_10644 [Hypoxylon sp. CI-4A]